MYTENEFFMYIEAICKNKAKEFNYQHAMTAHATGNIDSSQFMKVIKAL